jgi:hypothetical protein
MKYRLKVTACDGFGETFAESLTSGAATLGPARSGAPGEIRTHGSRLDDVDDLLGVTAIRTCACAVHQYVVDRNAEPLSHVSEVSIDVALVVSVELKEPD